MRGIWILLAIAGCGSDPPKQEVATLDGWQLTAAVPTVSGSQISGSFTTVGEGMRGYGACLLVDVFGGKECTTPADCATGAVTALPTGHFEYCIAPEGETRSTCWTKSSDMEWCNKSPGRAAGTNSVGPVDAAAASGGQKTRWITLGCLNAGTYPMFSDGPLPPCASSDPAARMYREHVPSSVVSFTP